MQDDVCSTIAFYCGPLGNLYFSLALGRKGGEWRGLLHIDFSPVGLTTSSWGLLESRSIFRMPRRSSRNETRSLLQVVLSPTRVRVTGSRFYRHNSQLASVRLRHSWK
jgi:hypothetical protein